MAPAAPTDRRHSWLGRQLGTLAIAQVQAPGSPATLRAAAWHNGVLRLGLPLPLFVVQDLGLLLTAAPGGYTIAPRPLVDARDLPPEARALLGAYRQLLASIAESELMQKAPSWRLRDEVIAVLIARIVGEPASRHGQRVKTVGAEPLPLDALAYPRLETGEETEVARHFADFDPAPLFGFVRLLCESRLEILTSVERIDIDTLRLMGLLGGGGGGAPVDLVDLYGAFQSVDGRDVADFSLDLLPSVLETRRASGVQTFAVDGYASIERRGSLDSLLLTEFAWDQEVFERKAIDQELYYYGRERQREDQRQLQYLLIDSSPSMRGTRSVFARGLALAMAKKLALSGDEVWMRFFDSRLHEVRRVSGSDFSVPYLLGFKSERGRNYGRVFRQLLVELDRLRRDDGRRIALYLITHGQCHLPVELVEQLADRALLYGVFILPSSALRLSYLPLLSRYQVVEAAALGSREGRRTRALDILDDVEEARRPAARPAAPPPAGPARRPARGAGRP